jgi:hypothetical protein
VVAALELVAQRGAGNLPSKAKLIAGLAQRTRNPRLFAACLAGELPVEMDRVERGAASEIVKDFLRDPLKSKPLGFWTQTTELVRLFQQDRLLQDPLADFEAVRSAITADPRLLAGYETLLRFAARLTNPFTGPDLRSGDTLLPHSRTHEESLLARMFPSRTPPPPGFSLIDELVKRIRSGDVDLRPRDDSGFYDHTLWALEPLLRPPRDERLKLGTKYGKHLEELARALWAQARETHYKSVARPPMAAPPGPRGPREVPRPKIFVRPQLTVEPLPEHYHRRADSYRFLREQMEPLIGEGAIVDKIRSMELLCRSAAATALRDLGEEASESELAALREWIIEEDADLSRDPRMMVPVYYVPGGIIKVWAVLGWTDARANISFRPHLGYPTIVSMEPLDSVRPTPRPEVVFVPEKRTLWRPVMVEVAVKKLLDRREFQALCDRFETKDEIVGALQRT